MSPANGREGKTNKKRRPGSFPHARTGKDTRRPSFRAIRYEGRADVAPPAGARTHGPGATDRSETRPGRRTRAPTPERRLSCAPFSRGAGRRELPGAPANLATRCRRDATGRPPTRPTCERATVPQPPASSRDAGEREHERKAPVRWPGMGGHFARRSSHTRARRPSFRATRTRPRPKSIARTEYTYPGNGGRGVPGPIEEAHAEVAAAVQALLARGLR